MISELLVTLGASAEQAAWFAANAPEHLSAGRVAAQLGPDLMINVGARTARARVSGSLQFAAGAAHELPVVGDFVGARIGQGEGEGRVELVVPRRSLLRRRAAGSDSEIQAIAANVDVVFAAAALERGFSCRRLTRAVALAEDAGALPVIVLTKADLCGDVARAVAEVTEAIPHARLIVVGAHDAPPVEDFASCMPERSTGVLIGMSGAGKSTLTNRLLATEQMAVAPVRDFDARGRHTTTHREILNTPWGAFLIDGPGVRELGVVDETSLDTTFDDIAELGQNCRFSDCTHGNEPGCAIQRALTAGELTSERFDAYRKLAREAAFLRAQADPVERRARKARHKALTASAWKASRRK